jgi:hypothetical protein
MDVAASCNAHATAQCVYCDIARRVATTGRELGDSACARPKINARQDRSRFCRGVNDIAIKDACGRFLSAARNVRRQSTAPEP